MEPIQIQIGDIVAHPPELIEADKTMTLTAGTGKVLEVRGLSALVRWQWGQSYRYLEDLRLYSRPSAVTAHGEWITVVVDGKLHLIKFE